MSPVLEAMPPKKTSTSSSYYNEWLNFLDEDAFVIETKQTKFPDLSEYIIERPDSSWTLIDSETSGSEKSVGQLESDVVDDVESPRMYAKNEFVVNLIIERIERGSPSLCDEEEL